MKWEFHLTQYNPDNLNMWHVSLKFILRILVYDQKKTIYRFHVVCWNVLTLTLIENIIDNESWIYSYDPETRTWYLSWKVHSQRKHGNHVAVWMKVMSHWLFSLINRHNSSQVCSPWRNSQKGVLPVFSILFETQFNTRNRNMGSEKSITIMLLLIHYISLAIFCSGGPCLGRKVAQPSLYFKLIILWLKRAQQFLKTVHTVRTD